MSIFTDKQIFMNSLLQTVTSALNKEKIPYYLDCGTLLGCIRENCLMDKDGDIDVAVHLSMWNKLNGIDFSKYGLVRTRTIGSYPPGYIISVKTNQKDSMYCDIYANPAFPLLTEKVLNGNLYSIPMNPELYLTKLYGNWKVPSGKHADWPKLFYNDLITSDYSKYWDSNFQIRIKPLPNPPTNIDCYKNLNQTFWNNYYNNKPNNIDIPSSFATFIFNKYILEEHTNNKPLKIADLGCGNCRDSKYFSEKGNSCYAIDYNGFINANYENCFLIKKDADDFFMNNNLNMTFNIIYMRWFLHAMPYEKATNIFRLSADNLEKGGFICVEVRSINDTELISNSVYDSNEKSYTTTHKRWLYSIDMVAELANNNNCEIIEIEEGTFSFNETSETKNPLLIRMICKKN